MELLYPHFLIKESYETQVIDILTTDEETEFEECSMISTQGTQPRCYTMVGFIMLSVSLYILK